MSEFDFITEVKKLSIEKNDIVIISCDEPDLNKIYSLRNQLDNNDIKNLIIALPTNHTLEKMSENEAKGLLNKIIEHRSEVDLSNTIEELRVKD